MKKKAIHNYYGRCKLCGVMKALTFEHVPPRVAFNKTTLHKSIKIEDLNGIEKIETFNPKGRILQGGIGYYALCKVCNNFLGKNYVPAYKNFVDSGIYALVFNPMPNAIYGSRIQEPLKILKQIISMFIVINDEEFGAHYPDLIKFVSDLNSKELPNRYNIYCYLKSSGQYRYCGLSFNRDPILGFITCSEMAFPPFGFILTIDYVGKLKPVENITSFKQFGLDEKVNLDLNLVKLETHLPFPALDYRSKELINKGIFGDNVIKSKLGL